MRRTGGVARTSARGVAAIAAGLIGVVLTVLPAAADQSRPTVDPSAPTPTAPYPGGPPQGHAPDGRTIGGEGVGTPGGGGVHPGGGVAAGGAPPRPDGLAAAGWRGADASSGQVLAARDPHGRYYP